MEWITAKYNKEVIDSKVYLTTLEFVEKQGKYNIFRTNDGKLVVTFDDQKKLLSTIHDNAGSVFAISFLTPDCTFKEYSIKDEEKACTLGRVGVAVKAPEGVALEMYYEDVDSLLCIAPIE
ncbi:hypothetical protein Goe16_00630 [Bacillus phage vB_BsuM-Goe16]|nr:hypothetical protein Goe16_00630 [Bacillus phage vB_BsuM-Goe16]